MKFPQISLIKLQIPLYIITIRRMELKNAVGVFSTKSQINQRKITFSMIAGKDNTDEDKLLNYERYRILRSGVIYGANGSGKSNFIDAILFVKNLVINSINHQPGQDIRQLPHKLLSIDADSTYSMQFVKDGVRYAFGFTVNRMEITDEYLFSFPNGRQLIIYERDKDGFNPGDRYKGKFESCKDVFRSNRLFLSCAANFSAVKEIESVFSFFKDDLVVYRGLGIDNWMTYSLNTIEQKPNIKTQVLESLDKLGTGIRDIDIKHSRTRIPQSSLSPFLIDEFKATLSDSLFDVYETKIRYEQFEVELQNESTGIRKLLEFICPLIDIISKGKVLICDEREAGFHESLVYGFVNLFRNTDTAITSQLIFTTHDTSILSLDLFRRDQIWFTELTTNTRATDLYSLAEIRNVRKDENILRGYMAGKYGAIPMLNATLASSLKKED